MIEYTISASAINHHMLPGAMAYEAGQAGKTGSSSTGSESETRTTAQIEKEIEIAKANGDEEKVERLKSELETERLFSPNKNKYETTVGNIFAALDPNSRFAKQNSDKRIRDYRGQRTLAYA